MGNYPFSAIFSPPTSPCGCVLTHPQGLAEGKSRFSLAQRFVHPFGGMSAYTLYPVRVAIQR
jgi:hypothetical protein